MPCVLCLKITNGRNRRIEFNSKQANEWDIKSIIELHFWRQIKDGPIAYEFICKQCWSSLSAFHQFYLTIENAHVLLMESIIIAVEESDAKEFEDDPEEIKHEPEPVTSIIKQTENAVENDLNNCISSQSTKRKRGSPSRQQLSTEFNEIKLSEIKIELPEPDVTIADALEENISIQKLVKRVYSQSTTDLEDNNEESDATLHSSQRKLKRTNKNATLKLASQALKKKKAERAKIRKESNEYINNNIKLLCHFCNETSFKDFANLLAHIRKEHDERGFMMCCGRKFYRRELLVDHLHYHENPEYFKCEQCGKVLTDRFSLELHLKVHAKKEMGRIYKCEECSKSFYNEVVLKRHLLTHVPEENRTVSCSQCDKQFPDDYAMKQHYSLTHLKKYAKICEICGKSVHGNSAFDRHMQEHIDGKRLFLNCDICGIKITNKWGLARHKKMMHTEENLRPIQCSICAKISPSYRTHRAHLRNSHNAERKHQCPMCDKAFKFPKILREHMTIHTGDVLYTCPHCPRTFNSNANMHSHRKKMHRAEWEANRRSYNRAGGVPQVANEITIVNKLEHNDDVIKVDISEDQERITIA